MAALVLEGCCVCSGATEARGLGLGCGFMIHRLYYPACTTVYVRVRLMTMCFMLSLPCNRLALRSLHVPVVGRQPTLSKYICSEEYVACTQQQQRLVGSWVRYPRMGDNPGDIMVEHK